MDSENTSECNRFLRNILKNKDKKLGKNITRLWKEWALTIIFVVFECTYHDEEYILFSQEINTNSRKVKHGTLKQLEP